jgi:uncharacterized protein YpmS
MYWKENFDTTFIFEVLILMLLTLFVVICALTITLTHRDAPKKVSEQPSKIEEVKVTTTKINALEGRVQRLELLLIKK